MAVRSRDDGSVVEGNAFPADVVSATVSAAAEQRRLIVGGVVIVVVNVADVFVFAVVFIVVLILDMFVIVVFDGSGGKATARIE